MKRLLMISYPFPPNASAGAVRSERFARSLRQFGWVVEVVTIKARRDMFQDFRRLKSLGSHLRVNFTRTVDPWLWLRDKNPGSLVLRAIRSILMRFFSFPDHMLLWVPFADQKGLEICKREKVDAIYSTSPPHSTHLAAQILSMLTRRPWVADFRDPWTLNAYRGKGVLDSFLLKIEGILEKGILRRASAILANTEANRSNLLKAYPGLAEGKVIHVPNGWEEFPADFYEVRRESGPLTIVHAGTFYPRFRPYALFYALAAWRNGKRPLGAKSLKSDDVRVILLGARDGETDKIIRELNLSEFVESRPWVALDEARRILCQADLLWASLGTGKESSSYIPSKIFEYIAAKRPIIGFFPEGESANLIRKSGSGIVFTEDDTEPVLRFLQSMKSPDWPNASKWSYRPVEEVIAEYHISNISSRLAALLERVSSVQ